MAGNPLSRSSNLSQATLDASPNRLAILSEEEYPFT